jgi:Ti-type conjugative transfer relaxase TraA
VRKYKNRCFRIRDKLSPYRIEGQNALAVYHATIRYLSRSNRNTVKAVAYRAGTDLYDQRTGQWFYHSDKMEVGHVELLLPRDAPAWAQALKKEISQNRKEGIQKLSDLTEASEKRKDSQVYREFEFALPNELTKEQNIKLANEFLQDQVCGRGIAVVASFHWDTDEKTGEARPHCHALFVTRRLEEKEFSEHKEPEWKSKAFLLTLREQLAAYTNFHLKLHGHDLRIDHRSYAEQGVEIESQHTRLLHSCGGFHEQTKEEIRRQYEITRQRNVARLIKKPETVFDIVTRQQSTFMWGDVEKVLARYVTERDIFDTLNARLKSSKELVLLREEERPTIEKFPVCDEETGENKPEDRVVMEKVSIYTTESMIRHELSLVRLAETLGKQKTHGTRSSDVNAAIVRANEEFAKKGHSLSQDQIDALWHITKADQLSCIVGYAGAGKSTTFRAAKEVWEASGYKVYGLAPTGRASQNLEEIGLSSTTLHKFLKAYDEGRSRYHEKSVLVLDEAGMVDVRRFNALLKAVDHLGVKLVISGDGAQSQPIEAGPGFRLVTERLGVKKIETIVRQKVEWQREATRLFGTYQTREALEMYLEKDHVWFVDEKVPDLDTLRSQKRYREVVELYNLSRRISGNIWHTICEDLKDLNITKEGFLMRDVHNQDGKLAQEEFLKAAVSHKDFAEFKKWQILRDQTADHIKYNLDTYRRFMKEKGVDPRAFTGRFIGRDMPEYSRHFYIEQLVKEWKLETPNASTPLHQCDLRKYTRQEMVRDWAHSLKLHPEASHLMVTYTNRDTHLLNEDARHLMRIEGVMSVDEYFHTVKRKHTDDFGRIIETETTKAFSKGERLVFTENNNSMRVKNGTLGTIEEINNQKLKVKIDGEERIVSFASNLYPYFDRGWAVNIIKSQGSTADHVFKLATFEEDRNLAYVGMTRHRKSLPVYGSKLDFWKDEIFVDRLSRNREKLSSLDYLSQEEAQSRLKPPTRLMDSLTYLGDSLQSFGYYTRKGWESVCERFLGKIRPEEQMMFTRGSIEEVLRAREMGINAALSSEKREDYLLNVLVAAEAKEATVASSMISVGRQQHAGQELSLHEREDESYNKAIIEKQNELRKYADNPEYVLSQLFGDSQQEAVTQTTKNYSFQSHEGKTELSQREMEDETYRKTMIEKQNELRKHANNPEYILSQLFSDNSHGSENQSPTENLSFNTDGKEGDTSQWEKEEAAYNKAIIEKQNELIQHKDNPEYILSQLSQTSFQEVNMSNDTLSSSSHKAEKASPVSLLADVSAFVDEQAKVDASKKEEMVGKFLRSENAEPHHSVEEVRRHLTPHSLENICYSLLGEPNRHSSNQRHLRYGNAGSLAISISGSNPGLWKDHSRDEGGDIFKLVMRERGVDFREALAWVAESLHVSPEKSSQKVSYASSSDNENDEAIKMRAVNIHLKACQPLKDTLGERYLREHRGIQGELPSDLQFIPSARNYLTKDTYEVYPALVALARNKDGEIKADQLIFLNEKTGQKADCEANRKSFGLLRGAYVQIQKGEGAAFMAEGVETALSIKEAGVKGDIYAVLGSENFKNASLFVDDKSRPVILCADQDGENSPSHKVVDKAVSVLKEEGFNVSVIRPAGSHEKEDFNDVLKREGVGGLREYFKEYIDPINLMSERQRAVFSKLEKSIMENKHFSEERKQKWIQFGLKDPQGTLMSWNNILIQQEIMDEQRQGKQAYYAQLHKPPASSPSEEPEIRETEAVLSFLETSQVIDPVDNMAQEMLVKVKGFMDTETFKKFESDLSSNTPEIIIGRCNDILTSREEALKLEADVNRFIELFDKAGLTSSLNSGESKDIFPVLHQIYEEWKNDERFEQRMKESGNTQAAKKVEQYRIEQRMRSLSHGYELEI